MSSYSRRHFLCLLLAAPAACGLTPAYGPTGAGNVLNGRVSIEAPATRPGYLLARHLETRLGRATEARFALNTTLRLTSRAAAIDKNNVTTRYSILGVLDYALRDLSTGAILSSGRLDSFTSYSASGTTVATAAAERDAEARLMTIFGDQLVNRLLADASNLPE